MSLEQIDLPCPFLEITGVPCPLCGGTRAVVHAVQLQSSFLDYNAVWVFAGVITALLGMVLLAVRQISPERFALVRGAAQATSKRARVTAVVIVFAIAWAWAIAHSATIAN